jgi:hypothetical protein
VSIAPHHGAEPVAPPAGRAGVSPATAVSLTAVEVLRLQPGDRLLVHADAALGIGGGGAHKIATQLAALLKLDELPFDVPVCVAAPGLRVEVLRPS